MTNLTQEELDELKTERDLAFERFSVAMNEVKQSTQDEIAKLPWFPRHFIWLFWPITRPGA